MKKSVKKSALSLMALSALLALSACQIQPLSSGNALPPAALQAQQAQQDALRNPPIDDSDISAGFRPQSAARLDQEQIGQEGETRIFATQTLAPVQPSSQGDSIQGRLVYTDAQGAVKSVALATAHLYQGNREVASALTDADGHWTLPVPPAGKYAVRYTLSNPHWEISRYSWQGPQAEIQSAVDLGETSLTPGSENGKAAWIHEIYLRVLHLLEREQVPLDWWKHQIHTTWPGQGDYYSFYTVNLTGAEQWDVNGHEIGHAIYDQALNAGMRGGQHKIDECYNGTLALSEGFATFLSGAASLSKDDPDAHFGPYLVPRRAPIRLENVPDDVCPGSRNEWRVASAFWEIYDSHEDGQDHISLGLKTIFAALGRADRPTAQDALAAYGLLKEGVPAEQQPALKAAFVQNTMEVQ